MVRLNIRKYISVTVIIVILLVLHYTGLSRPVENVLGSFFSPVFRVFYSAGAGVSRTYQDSTAKENLEDKLAKAQNERNILTAENAKLKFLEEENTELRKQLNFLSSEKRRFLMANVISRGNLADDTNGGQSIVIDRGTADGLYPGLPVVSTFSNGTSTEGVIIGKVAGVKEHMAEIYLVTNKNCKLAASILGESKTSGVAAGELGLTVKMRFIPQTENIKTGDIVATSGLEQNIKRGLVIGRVSGVDKENNEVWQSATIEPLLNLDNLTIVSVLLP